MMLRNRSVIDYFFLRLKYSLRPVCQLQVAGGAAAVNPSKALNSQPCYFKFGAVNRSLLYFINRISLVPTFFKSQSALIPLLLLSDRDSLRWIRSRFLAGDETKISGMKPPDTSEQSPLCSDVLLFLRNKRTSSARSLAPPFQIEPAALGFDLGWKTKISGMKLPNI